MFEEEKTSGDKNCETKAYVTPGTRYELFDNLEIGVGVPIGMTYESYNWALSLKYSMSGKTLINTNKKSVK